jgi:hypothetical protein
VIVGGYSLHLYCRYDASSTGRDAGTVQHPYDYFPHQYAGKTEADCMTQARQDGWVFNRDHDVTCPLCARKR